MKFVIDSNILQTQSLEQLLSSSQDNFAIMTSEIWFELYKQRCSAAINRGLSIVGRYPDQIITLRSTREILRLDPRLPNFLESMQMPQGRHLLRQMMQAVSRNEIGSPAIQSQLAVQWNVAEAQNESMLTGALDVLASLPEMQEQMFSETQIRICRTRGGYTNDMFANIFGAVDQIWEALSDKAGIPWLPNFEHRTYTFLYRLSLGIVVHLLWWIEHGSQSKKAEATRNDVIDIFLATHASYADGFATEDKKARWIHSQMIAALAMIDRGAMVRRSPAPL